MTTASAPSRLAWTLGVAGLLPFVGPALMLALETGPETQLAAFAGAYAFGIICFLCGSWWGLALPRKNAVPLLCSNLLFLVAFFSYLYLPDYWPLAAALLLLTLFAIETGTRLLPTRPAGYGKLRALLTFGAALSMLLVHAQR